MAIEGHSKSIRNLIMGDNMSFHVPIYQRSYTWEAKNQVEKLLNDILEFATEYRGNSNGEYYVGNVILKNQSRGFVTERTVIDGQQRITTTILILCALRDLYLEHESNDDELASARAITRALYIDDGNVRRLKLDFGHFCLRPGAVHGWAGPGPAAPAEVAAAGTGGFV